MGELIDRDQEHLRLVEIGFYVEAGLIAFVSLFALIYVGLGMVFISAFPKTGTPANDVPVAVMGWIFMGIGGVLFVLGGGFAFLLFYAARGLRVRQHRILCLILAGLCCLQIPWGTVFGVLAIIVLNRESVIPLFDQPARPGPPALH
jgi:hypothetical protein